MVISMFGRRVIRFIKMPSGKKWETRSGFEGEDEIAEGAPNGEPLFGNVGYKADLMVNNRNHQNAAHQEVRPPIFGFALAFSGSPPNFGIVLGLFGIYCISRCCLFPIGRANLPVSLFSESSVTSPF